MISTVLNSLYYVSGVQLLDYEVYGFATISYYLNYSAVPL